MMNLTASVCLFTFCYDLFVHQPDTVVKAELSVDTDVRFEGNVTGLPQFSLDEDGHVMASHNEQFSLYFESWENASYYGFELRTNWAYPSTNGTYTLRGDSPSGTDHTCEVTITILHADDGECEEGKTLPTLTHAIDMYLANSSIVANKSFPIIMHGNLYTFTVWSRTGLAMGPVHAPQSHLVCVSPLRISIWLAPILLIGIVFTSVISWMGINVSKKRRSTIV